MILIKKDLAFLLMDILYSKIIGLPILAVESFRPLYQVQEVIIDHENGRILAFLADKNSGIVITPHDIVAIRNAIFIKSGEDLSTIEDILRVDKVLKDFGVFYKKNVETEDGKDLGKVIDIAFDSQLSCINKLLTAKNILGIFQVSPRVIPGKNIIEARADKIIVKDDQAFIKEMVKGRAKEKSKASLIAETGTAIAEPSLYSFY